MTEDRDIPALDDHDCRMTTTPPDVSDARDQALRLWVVLSRAYHSIATRLQADVARHDITLTEFGILEVLYHKGPLLLGEVQRRILVSSGGITYLVDRLEAKGLVERRACEHDRRARYATLTREGEAFIARIFPEHAEMIETLLSGLDTDERAALHPLLRQLGLSVAGKDSALGPADEAS